MAAMLLYIYHFERRHVMLDDTINKLKSIIDHADNLTDQQRQKLSGLTNDLRGELEKIEHSHEEDMKNIHEAMEDSSLHDLKNSVEKLEVEHPNMTRVLQSIFNAFGV